MIIRKVLLRPLSGVTMGLDAKKVCQPHRKKSEYARRDVENKLIIFIAIYFVPRPLQRLNNNTRRHRPATDASREAEDVTKTEIGVRRIANRATDHHYSYVEQQWTAVREKRQRN